MQTVITAIPEDLTSNGHLFRVDSRGKYVPCTTSSSKGGIYHFELNGDLSSRVLPNGRKVIEKVVNLETTDFERAIERARSLILERKAMSVMKVGNILNSADLITESVRNADPNGGSADRVWERFAHSDIFQKKPDVSKHNFKSSFKLIASHVGDKSLYDFTKDDAAAFVENILKTHSVSSLRKVYLPSYREIWNVALPLIKNPWYDCVKWDDMRQMLAVSGHGAEITPEMSLGAFSEEYFRREAGAGRKWEKNTEGFMRHFTSHMGVRKVGDVTQEIAMEYARRMVEDPAMRVNRNGRDRISKFHTMWAMLLPDLPNPWDNVCYDVAVREFKPREDISVESGQKQNESQKAIENRITRGKYENCDDMPEIGFASSSDCYRCECPERIWDEYVSRHEMTEKRACTTKSMFMRLWRVTGFKSPKQITSAVAQKYCEDTVVAKRSANDDMVVLRLVWDTVMPGVKNPWPANISRKTGCTFSINVNNEGKTEKKEEEKIEPPKEQSGVFSEAFEVPECRLHTLHKTHEDLVGIPSKDEQKVEESVSPEIMSAETIAENAESSDKISFDRMFAIWRDGHVGRYQDKTYSSYHNRLRRFAGWAMARGITEIGPGDVTLDMAHEYLDHIKSVLQVPEGEVSVLRIMWDNAFPESKCLNPWKQIFTELTKKPQTVYEWLQQEAAEDKPIRVSVWKRISKWFGKLFGQKEVTLES